MLFYISLLKYKYIYFSCFSQNSILTTMWDFLTGLNPSIIGAFSGVCAFMGVAATFISSDLVRRFGILKVSSSA